MSVTPLVYALRSQREGLASRWCARLAENQAEFDGPAPALSGETALALVDEVIALIEAEEGGKSFSAARVTVSILGSHRLPENVTHCVHVYQAGAQVIGAFVVENAGPLAAWSLSQRNRFLGELDAVFHLLLQHEIDHACHHHRRTRRRHVRPLKAKASVPFKPARTRAAIPAGPHSRN